MDAVVVRDVISIVAIRGRIEGHQPDARDAETREIREAIGESDEIADAVAIGIEECLDVQAIDDRVLVPEVVDHLDILLHSRARSSAFRI